MPPKRKATVGKAVSASQPEPHRPTRTSTRKRRHSDNSEISDAPSIEAAAKTPAKRRKRAPTPAEVIVEEEEEEEVVVQDTPALPKCDAEEIEVAEAEVEKHVHFGSDAENVDPENPSATNITPHPRAKMTIKRRTLSPNPGGETKRIKTARTSLPAVLQDTEADPVKIVSEWKFAPLRAVLGERITRLLRLKEDDLETAEEVEDAEMQDDILVLDNYEEITYPQLPAPASASMTTTRRVTLEESAERSAAKIRASWDEERQRFHDAILAFQQEAEQAKADLRILTIELESLGFEGGESTLDVLRSIRESFDTVHEFLEAELPGTVPDDATNQDLVEILIANVKEFADRLRTADKELLEKGTLNADLGNQVHDLIDRLAEREVKYQQLQDERLELEELVDAKDVRMQDLEETIQSTRGERDERQLELDEEFDRAERLEGEKTELETTLERLTTSLETYRAEETRLTALITKMEEEHRKTVASMNVEREQTVRELEENLDNEIERRADVEKLAREREETITATTSRLRDVEQLRDSLVDERNNLRIELADSEETIATLEDRITRVEEEMSELQDQLSALREQNATEREQREAAEAEIDTKNDEIDELNRKLREQGKEANELRLKAHDIQAKNQKRIVELEGMMSDQDAKFQEDIADEVNRREDAEALSQDYVVEIEELRVKLSDVEKEMRTLLAERDARITELEADVAQKDDEIAVLQEDLRTAEQEYQVQLEQKNAKIALLQITIEEHNESIRELQLEAEEAVAQTEERDTAVANLNHRVAALEAEKAELEEDKDSLERRVESEALQMLEVSNDFQEQVDDLKAQLLDKQHHIAKVQNKSQEAEAKWTELLETREQQIDDWKLTSSTQEETITTLTERNQFLQEKFRAYVRRSDATVEYMQTMLDEARAAMDDEGEKLREEGQDVLAELETLVVPVGEVVTKTTKKVVKQQKGRKKRVMDSGVGMEEDEVEMIEA